MVDNLKSATLRISFVLLVPIIICVSCSGDKEDADSDREMTVEIEEVASVEEAGPEPTGPAIPAEIKPLWSISSDIDPYDYEQPYAVLNGAIYFTQFLRDQNTFYLVKLDSYGTALWNIDFGTGSPRVIHIGQSGTAYVEVSTSNPATGGTYHITAVGVNGNAENIGESYYGQAVDVVETATAIVIISYDYTGYDLDRKQQWVLDDAPRYIDRAIGAGEQIYSLGFNYIEAITSDGRFLWHKEFENRVEVAVGQNGIVVVAESDRLTTFSDTGVELWSTKLWTKEPAEGSQHAVLGVEIRSDTIIVANGNTGEIRAFDEMGDNIWSIDTAFKAFTAL